MARYRMTLTFDVEIADEAALQEYAFEDARRWEETLPEVEGVDRFSATDSVVGNSGSALVMMTHQAIGKLPGVGSVMPVQGGTYEVTRLD